MSRSNSISRRDFIRLSAMGIGAAAISTGLAGCGGDSQIGVKVKYSHGVASGDPLQDKVIIWTRITPAESVDIKVYWEVSEDAEFTSLIHQGHMITSPERDYTVKVDIQNLLPGRTYFYRFIANNVISPVGQMKTLPSGSVDKVKLAVFSCANYPAGFFNVYGEAAKRNDIDAVLHLGDYLYEYAMGGYATENAIQIGRAIPQDNDTELVSLSDYRKRYALYRSDEQLQGLHAKVPFICVWDDHEVANDAWRNGAENHQAEEGSFDERKMQALQAYFEWLPIRPANPDDNETIYRYFEFGDLASLYMLDTRLIGRDLQLDFANYTDPVSGSFNSAQFIADVADANRTLLGADQLLWLQQTMMISPAKWQVLGQQVLMGRMNIPAELLRSPSKMGELVAIKLRMDAGDPTLTEEEQTRVLSAVPYNLDAWDGYAYEREVIFGLVKQLDKDLIVLAGDTHNAWANNLTDRVGDAVGVEFAAPSVTSPGLESYLNLGDDPVALGQAEFGFTTLINDLQYMNISQRGYLTVTLTPEKAEGEWVFVNNILSPTYSVDELKGKRMHALPGSDHRTLVDS